MKRIVFLEGLPSVGKTSILNYLKDKFSTINTVPELLGIMPDYHLQNQTWFMWNDDKKIKMYSNGNIVIDRGPLSTLAYNQTRKITDKAFKFDLDCVSTWFLQYANMYQDHNVYVIYLTTHFKRLKNTIDIITDPYGSVENQQLLEQISIFNLKKYVKNYKIIDYYFDNLEEVINEITNKFMCS